MREHDYNFTLHSAVTYKNYQQMSKVIAVT